jgi:hypothetical protein
MEMWDIVTDRDIYKGGPQYADLKFSVPFACVDLVSCFSSTTFPRFPL